MSVQRGTLCYNVPKRTFIVKNNYIKEKGVGNLKSSVKIGLGIFTSVSVMGFIVSWDVFLKDKIDSVPVVVVKQGQTINVHEEINNSKLTIERRNKKDLIDGVITADKSHEVLNFEANQVIPGNQMLSVKMVDKDRLLPNPDKGESIRPIVADMIFAMPGSLRRKDKVNIYGVDQSLISKLKESGEKTSISESLPSDMKMTPILKNIRVAYVKDSANKEVMEVQGEEKEEQKKEARLNATGSAKDIEVILDNNQFDTLMQTILDKNQKLYITYN